MFYKVYLEGNFYMRDDRLIIRKERPEDYYDVEYMTKKAFWNLHVPGCE